MPRIRTIKPEFFRDEILQDLERAHPELHPMLVFAALWGHCDKQGVFEWRPRQLALDILPFLWPDTSGTHLGHTLEHLRGAERVRLMEHDGRLYGHIPTFSSHQRITGSEGKGEPRFPDVADMVEVTGDVDPDSGHCPSAKNTNRTHLGHTEDTPGTHSGYQEGKGREGNEEVKPPIDPPTPKPRKKPARALPADWEPKDSHRKKAEELGLDLPAEVEAWKDHHLARDNRFADWDLTFHTWLRNTQKYGPNGGRPNRRPANDTTPMTRLRPDWKPET
jgi:hypothetical protein